ncbi:hypothetical protein LPJ57_002495, partial [Coemansia sp. RSA 486]
GTVTNARTGATTDGNKHFKSTLLLPHSALSQGIYTLKYVPTGSQVADYLTKVLPIDLFVKHRKAADMK